MPKVVEIKIEKDRSDEVIKALKDKVPTALAAIGSEAATYAMKDAPVDTGRLQGSIAWATSTETGGGDSVPKATPEEGMVYIGSNVEYAAVQEYGDFSHRTGKKHYLKDAAANHADHYAEILKAALDT